MILVLFILCISINSYSQPIFTNMQYVITGFPNIVPNGKSYDYTVSSYNSYLKFSFPIILSPLSKVHVYGMKYNSSIYIENSNNVQLINKGLKILNKFSDFRIDLSKKILINYPNIAPLILALVLGNKYFLSKEFMDYVRASGISHIFALSGLHLAIFISVILYFGKIIGLSLRITGLIALPLALFYLLLGGMSASLQRAFLFYLIWLITIWTRTPISISKIFLTSLILSFLIAPKSIFSLSFLMSYLAVFGIIYYNKIWNKFFIKFFGKFFGDLISVSISASIAVLPLIIWNFKEFNILFLLSNIIILPFMPFIIIISLLLVLLLILNIRSINLELIIDLFYQGILFIIKFISVIPKSMIFFSNPKEIAIIMFITILFIYKKYSDNKR